MADIFVSYTSSDRDWAFWIGQQLEKLGHTAHVHEWEIAGGGDIFAWMEDHHDEASHVLCVVSEAYLKAPYSALERRAAQWAAINRRPNFALPVFIEPCEAPTLLAVLKRCDLHGLTEDEALTRLKAFTKPASKPTGPIPFPGIAKPATDVPKAPVSFPGGPHALSNIPIVVPRYFLGRDEVLAEIEAALADHNARVAITALYGMRGVGKTTLAAAYAEFHRGNYRATWWIRAGNESTMRADLTGLGVRLGWAALDQKEDPALATVMERLRHEGSGILLIFDNAIDADSVEAYLPGGGDAQIIITSNAHAWRNLATPLPIDTWPNEIGADYLISRTGRNAEREAALALSNALGGLPLAHEQAAAYCERLEVPLAAYHKRFEAAPVDILDDKRDAPRAYHNRLTAAKTFALAIDEAAKLHPAAEPLIVYASLLAPEPIPLYLFSEGREKFGEPLASALADDGLDEAVAALRAFALVDRETIPDEREPAIKTDCIRLHRLVRQVAALRCERDPAANSTRALIAALLELYPSHVFDNPDTWPRVRRLDALALALVAGDAPPPDGAEIEAGKLLNNLAAYRVGALAAYAQARPLAERALAIRERALGADHPDTSSSLNNLGYLLQAQDDLAGSRPYYERALAIHEKALGPDHPDTARSLNNLGALLRAQGDLAGARPYYDRALAICEQALGPDHPDTALSLNNLGYLLQVQGDFAGARPYYGRALAIYEKALGPEHPDTAGSLNNLGALLQAQGDLAGARPHHERALAICEKVLGPDHPDTALSLYNLGGLLRARGDLAGARPYCERALAIVDNVMGAGHPTTKTVARNAASVLEALKRTKEAKALRKKFGIEG